MSIVISQETTPNGEGSDQTPDTFQSRQVHVMRSGAFALPIQGGATSPGQVPPAPRNGNWSGNTTSGSAPHVLLSSRTPTGLPTRGFTLGLPSTYNPYTLLTTGVVAPVAGGFNLIVYVRNPGTFSWFALKTLTGAKQDTLYVLGELNACELYFSLDVDSIASINGIAYAASVPADIAWLPIEVMELG